LDFVSKRQVAVTVFNALSDFKPVERAYDRIHDLQQQHVQQSSESVGYLRLGGCSKEN